MENKSLVWREGMVNKVPGDEITEYHFREWKSYEIRKGFNPEWKFSTRDTVWIRVLNDETVVEAYFNDRPLYKVAPGQAYDG